MWKTRIQKWIYPIVEIRKICDSRQERLANRTTNMKLKHTIAAALLLPASVQAATITAAGIDTLTPPGNAVGTDVADLDANGSGTDGFVVFNSIPEGGNQGGKPWNESMVDSLPAYISNLDGSASTSSGGWANYDDTLIGGNLYNTGGIANSPGNGVETAVFTFQLSGAVPSSINLGILTDASDNLTWTATGVRIEGPGAVTASQSLTVDGAADLLNFTIDGGVAGETYTVHATSAASGIVIAAATFDSVPEPSSALLGLLGSLALLRRRR